MGRGKKQETASKQGPAEDGVRRSARKRIVKRDSDYDYESFDLKASPQKVSPKVRKLAGLLPPSSHITHYSKEEKEPDNVPEDVPEDEFHEEEDSEEIIVHKPSSLDLSQLNPSEIIETHCEILERRLKKVAYEYLGNWSAPQAPKLVAPPPPIFATPTVPDEVVVRKVVKNIVGAVALVTPSQGL